MESSSYKTRLIGRDTELRFLEEKLLHDNIYLLQVYGQPCVGKSELVWEVLRLMRYKLKNESFYCKSIILQESESWSTIERKIFQFKSLYPNPCRLLVVLKNFHLISPEIIPRFREFCCQMSLEGMMSIIIIHHRVPEFDFKGVVSEKLHVPPLDEDDGKMLFCKHAKIAEAECENKYIDYLVDQCSGLPGLIINLACKWKEWSSFASLEEFYNYFRRNDNLFQFMRDVICPQLCINKSFNLFFEYLPDTLKKALAELSVCPGPLSIDQMTYMLDDNSDQKTKFEVALPLVMLGFLKKKQEKFKVKPMIRDVANQQLFHMYDEDVNKLKFVNIMGNVLLKAEEIYRKNMPMQTLGIVRENWDNIEFLLRRGIHLKSDGQAIPVLFEVATEAGDVISACCPGEAKEFFESCLNEAEKVGTTEQKAMMQVRYGQSLTNEGGAGGEKNGMIHYRKAITALKKGGKDYRTLCLLNSMAYNYYRQGSLHNACKCAKEAIGMEVRDQDTEATNHVKINSASIYAYTLIYLGQIEEAKRFLLKTLEEVGDSNHASISVILNSLGLAEEGPNGNEIEALKWYSRSLSMRRKMSAIKPENLVIPLCHIADLASKQPQKYDMALKYLNEATEIMKKKCWIHIHSASIQYTFGIVYMRMKSIETALSYFKDALRIHQILHPNHYFNATLRNWISHCHLLMDDITKAIMEFEETRKMMEELIHMRPNACYLAQPLEHLVRMTYRNEQKMVPYQNNLINELQRLVNFPGLDKISICKYENILEVYKDCMKGTKCLLEKLPMTCTVCTDIIEQKICPVMEYKEKVNMVSYAGKLPQRPPIPNSKICHRPPRIKYFSGAPQPPDPDPVPESLPTNAEEHNLCLWTDGFISDSNSQRTQKSHSVYKDSSTYFKTSHSNMCSDKKSPDLVFSKPFWSLCRPPLQSMEHSMESSSIIRQKVQLNDLSKTGESYAVKSIISETNEETCQTIKNIIFEDQSREYNGFSSQESTKYKPIDFSSVPCSQVSGTRVMNSDSPRHTKLGFMVNVQNKITEKNPFSENTKLSSEHFGNPENKMNLNIPQIILEGNYQHLETEMNRYHTRRTTHMNLGSTGQNNLRDRTQLSNPYSSAIGPLEPENTQIITTGRELVIAHHNEEDQNPVSVSDFNIPNFHDLSCN